MSSTPIDQAGIAPSILILKEDSETSDDLKLALLEARGISGNDSFTSLKEWNQAINPALLAEGQKLARDNDHILVGLFPREGGEVFQKRAGFYSHLLQGDTQAISVTEAFQTYYERSAGATGLKATSLSGLNRKKNEYLTHSFHKYKAKFFPRMARALTNYVLPAGGRVLDPFMGSGTLGVEATLMGVQVEGIDVDPLSVEMAKLKVDAIKIPTGEARKAYEHFLVAVSANQQQGLLWGESSEPDSAYELPEFIRKKITPEALRDEIEEDTRIALSALSSYSDEEGRRFLRIALSHALATKVGLRWMGTGDNRFALAMGARRLIRVMSNHLSKMVAALEQRDLLISGGVLNLSQLGSANIQRGDVRMLPYKDNSIDGIVTSPPYLPASSGRETYLRSRACSLTALGLMSEAEIMVRETEMVGSIIRTAPARSSGLPHSISELVEWMEPQRARKPKALATSAYFLDIAQSLREMARVTKPGGKIALVVSSEHVFYDLLTREVVRRVSMPEAISEIISEPHNEIPLKLDNVVKIQLPKMDYVARPASKGDYAEAVVIATKV
ncbi:TRM11 family SAM-dependent methyltransferase [Streptomyces hygroscopicus]|uniref:TRM11 family SAM-dependent methyltransferase n=1 Tax=Streptomyces hygroscopicus TaxID=1912 RepID=UPI0036A12C6F